MPADKVTCAERLQTEYEERMSDLRKLWAAYGTGKEEVEDLGSIYDYGLCFDWVERHTFENQPEGHYRYQLSCGGPQDEFRFFPRHWRVEYWFLDWFDGAHLEPTGDDRDLLTEIYGWFEEMGMCSSHNRGG